MANPQGVAFEVHIVGDETGDTFTGTFRAKEKLSWADQLGIDARRRELLGQNSAEAPMGIYNMAMVLSELAFRLTEAPEWWKTSFSGMQLSDDNVVLEVYEKAKKVREDWLNAQKTKGEKARAALAAKQNPEKK